MELHEIREKTLEDIKNDLLAAEENLRTLGFQLVTSQLENTALYKRSKREIAQLRTIIREREMGIHTMGEQKVMAEGENGK